VPAIVNDDPWHDAHEFPGSIVDPVPEEYVFPLEHCTGVL
jgi:hypothetical protein